MELRYYQKDAVEAIYRYFYNASGNPVVAMPTGTGKSLVIGEFVRSVISAYPTQRIMMLTHVKELIAQNFEKLLALWPTAPAGIYSAGLGRRDTRFPITFAGIASVAKKPLYFGHVDLVLIDECHLVSPKATTMYCAFLNELRRVNPHLKVIGFTATNYRMGLGHLTKGGLFTDVCFDITTLGEFNKLVDEGYLAPLVPKRTSIELDTSSVAVHGGEFVQKALQAAVDKEEITRVALNEITHHAAMEGRKSWLIFASGVQHARHIAEALVDRGVSAVSVDSDMAVEERDEVIRGFRTGRYTAIVNNNILTTGFDHPSIDLIGMLRPTRSTGLWVQMLGRGTRPAPGKENCLVLDFAGNTRRLGPINDPVIPKPKGAGGGTAPVKVCEVCGTYNHASVRECANCGHEFPRPVNIETRASTEELLRRDREPIEAPQYITLDVSSISYRPYAKKGSPPSLLVSYFCGLRMFKEWVCLEHKGFPRHQAHEWWLNRTYEDVPETVHEALDYLDALRKPKRIRVWINKEYPEIVDYEFT